MSELPAPPPPAHQPPTQGIQHSSTQDTRKSTTKGRPSVTIAAVSDRSERTLGGVTHEKDGPPPLNYTIKANNRERKVLTWFTLFFFEAGVLPLILFFSLRWGAHLSSTKNLAIITSLIGSVSGYKFANRTWTLWYGKEHHTFRPIGAGRWGLDSFQISIALAMGAFFIPLIIGSSVNPGSPRIVALALPAVMIILCFPLLCTGLLPHKIRLPIRVSSFPHWTPLPPLAYVYVEDVVAVDGGAATEFRQAWRVRYEESKIMRELIRWMSLLWGSTGCLVATALIVIDAFTSIDIGYGCCYGLPWLWALLTAAYSVHLCYYELERERQEWPRCPAAHRVHELPIRDGKFDPPVDDYRRSFHQPRRAETVIGAPDIERGERGEFRPPPRTATF